MASSQTTTNWTFLDSSVLIATAAAVHAQANYLATYDRKHLLGQKEAISAAFGLRTATPDEVLRLVGTRPSSSDP